MIINMITKKYFKYCLIFLIILNGSFITTAQNINVDWSSFGTAGGNYLNNNSKHIVSIGQPLIGESIGNNIKISGGFLVHKIFNSHISALNNPGSVFSHPVNYTLYQNYPNPFNPTTTIKYEIPEAKHVTLQIFDILGNEVETLVNKEQPAGSYKAKFAVGNKQLASGIYLYKLQAGSFIQTKKMVLLK